SLKSLYFFQNLSWKLCWILSSFDPGIPNHFGELALETLASELQPSRSTALRRETHAPALEPLNCFHQRLYRLRLKENARFRSHCLGNAPFAKRDHRRASQHG